MHDLRLHVVSLRYSSWSMRAWLALRHAGADFVMETVELPEVQRQAAGDDGKLAINVPDLASRRRKGSVTGLFPVLWVDGTPIHEALAICEWVAEAYPAAGLWPDAALERARARSVCSEMASGFHNIRGDLNCHIFARAPRRNLRPETQREVDRVIEIWDDLLQQHGGPFLTGRFGIVDCMYFPVLTRFRTYDVELPAALETYARRLESSPPVLACLEQARQASPIPVYDEYVRALGGDPYAIANSA
jgi:glutathione S-transferase